MARGRRCPGATSSRERQGLRPSPLPLPARASVVQVLLLPGGRGDGAVRVHDDLGTADDHHDEEQAEEDEAGQGQSIVHVHVDGLRRGVLHLSVVASGSSSGTGLTGTIFHPCRKPGQCRSEGYAHVPAVGVGVGVQSTTLGSYVQCTPGVEVGSFPFSPEHES